MKITSNGNYKSYNIFYEAFTSKEDVQVLIIIKISLYTTKFNYNKVILTFNWLSNLIEIL